MRDDDRRLMTLLGQGQRVGRARAPGSGARSLRVLGWLMAVLAAISFTLVVWRDAGQPGPAGPAPQAEGPRADVRWWGNPQLGTGPDLPTEEVLPLPTQPLVPEPVNSPEGLFQLDERGQLQLDERTRLEVERLLAMHDPQQLEQRMEEHLVGLPSAAVAAARQLVQQYAGYADAQKRSYPPGTAPLVAEEGLAELDGLNALRVSYFGREAAQRMFGEEEAIARRLLELMRDDPVPHAPMEEKAMRAQVRLDEEMASGRFPAARP